MNDFFGALAPFIDLVGVKGERRDHGSSLVTLRARPEIGNTVGAAHGGAIATLLDVALATAANSLHPDKGMMTVSMTLNFLRPGRGLLQARAKVRQEGRTLVFCDGEVVDEAGKLVATAMGTFTARRRTGG